MRKKYLKEEEGEIYFALFGILCKYGRLFKADEGWKKKEKRQISFCLIIFTRSQILFNYYDNKSKANKTREYSALPPHKLLGGKDYHDLSFS